MPIASDELEVAGDFSERSFGGVVPARGGDGEGEAQGSTVGAAALPRVGRVEEGTEK